MPFQPKRTPIWWPLVLLAAVVILCVAFRGYGMITAVILVATYFAARQIRPHSPEIESIRSSLELSIEDIEATMHAIETSPKNPQLNKYFDGVQLLDYSDLDLESLQLNTLVMEYQHSKLFVDKVRERPQVSLTIQQLERLLELTDQRAETLHEAWTNCPKSLLNAKRPSESSNCNSSDPASRRPAEEL